MTAERILETQSIPDLDQNVAEQDIFAEGQAQVCGRDHAVQMLAYGTQKASAAWKMFAKSQDIDFATANEVSAQIKRYENKLRTVDEEEKDSVDIMDFIDKKFHEIYIRSTEYQGIITSWSPAPCAFLLYQGSIRRKIGLVKIKDKMCCAMDGHWAEKNHFLKNDLLRVAVVDLINKGYHRAGLKVPTVNELLAMCPPDDIVWGIYRKGCTLGINQVEQPGTASRVGVYAPTNISELCAFIAAIRPGFKSMYKTFESRQDFSYDVKPFDELLRTDELPQSFCLYQEQQMAALNFAGFPMKECYAAVKNIAKKRKEKVLAYRERFINGFSKKLIEQEHLDEKTALEKTDMVWKIIEDSASYSFNACVTGDTMFRKADGTVESVYKLWDHGPDSWNIKGLSLTNDGQLVENELVSVKYAGRRTALRIVLKNGAHIDCTHNHKFPTPAGEKRFDQLKVGDELYVRIGKSVATFPIVKFEQGKLEHMYDVEMRSPYHNFTLENGIITSNSHSYCVSLDSLYGAWLKAHHPLAFYETFMRIMDEKGDKDKLSAARDEAESYFNIKFPPFRFGQDNRKVTADEENNAINNALTSIKGFNKAAAVRLYEIGVDRPKYLTDVLLALRPNGIKAATTEPLAKISYFQPYGNDREVLNIISLCEELDYGGRASLPRERVDNSFLAEIVPKYADGSKKDGSPASKYTFASLQLSALRDEKKRLRAEIKKTNSEEAVEQLTMIDEQIEEELKLVITQVLHECEERVLSAGIQDLPFKTKIANQRDVLGYVDIQTGREEDRRRVLVTDFRPLLDKEKGKPWGYLGYTRVHGKTRYNDAKNAEIKDRVSM